MKIKVKVLAMALTSLLFSQLSVGQQEVPLAVDDDKKIPTYTGDDAPMATELVDLQKELVATKDRLKACQTTHKEHSFHKDRLSKEIDNHKNARDQHEQNASEHKEAGKREDHLMHTLKSINHEKHRLKKEYIHDHHDTMAKIHKDECLDLKQDAAHLQAEIEKLKKGH